MMNVNSLLTRYRECRVGVFPKRIFTPQEFHGALDDLTRKASGLWTVTEIGRSYEGRPLRLVSAGKGKTAVFGWSQMHGDESTATMAILDILNFLLLTKAERETAELLD